MASKKRAGARLLETSYAVEFLARQRHPFLIAKLRHLPLGDWQNDFEDVRNLVASLSRDRRIPLRWRVVDWNTTDLLRELSEAFIVFLNGHEAPELPFEVRRSLPPVRQARGLHPRRRLLRQHPV